MEQQKVSSRKKMERENDSRKSIHEAKENLIDIKMKVSMS